jgi:hypothetical protein
MHLKKVVKKEGKFFIENYVIVDAIDGSDTYYEGLNWMNCWKFFPEILVYLWTRKQRTRR